MYKQLYSDRLYIICIGVQTPVENVINYIRLSYTPREWFSFTLVRVVLLVCYVHFQIFSTPFQLQALTEIDGLVQERCNSSALAMKLCFSCTKLSNWKFVAYGITGFLEIPSIPVLIRDLYEFFFFFSFFVFLIFSQFYFYKCRMFHSEGLYLIVSFIRITRVCRTTSIGTQLLMLK